MGSARYDAHDSIRDQIIVSASLAGLKAGSRAPSLPHGSPQERGDLIVHLRRSYARGQLNPANRQFWDSIIGDVTLVHPREGATDDRTRWGEWADSKVRKAIDDKEKNYKPYEHNSTLCFLPMAISTYGDMCDDLLRFLWFIAEAQMEAAAHRGALDVDTAPERQVKLFAAKIRARIACATAVGVAKRIACLQPHDFRLAKPTSPEAPLDFRMDEPLFPS